MKKKINQSGFGIIEVLISAMIMVMIVGSAIGLSREILKSNILASQRVTAYNLAREELEIARAARDTASIDKSTGDWDEYFACTEQNNCYFEKDPTEPSRWKSISGVEQLETIDGVDYQRSFKLSKIPAGSGSDSIEYFNNLADPDNISNYDLSDEIWVITTEVTWQGHSVKASNILTNWKPQV